MLAILAALFVFSSCDVYLVDESFKQVEVYINIYDSAEESDNLYTESSDNYTIESIEIDVQNLRLKNIEGDPLDFKIFESPLKITTFNSDIKISENILFNDVYNIVDLKVGSTGQADKWNDPIDPTASNNHSTSQSHDPGNAFSFKINGTFNEKAFTYYCESDLDLNFALTPPLKINEYSESINKFRFLIDYSEWFKNPVSNELIDPSDPANKQIIDANILHSLTLYQDLPVFSVSDAEASVGDDVISFIVSIQDSASLDNPITIDFETSDLSAKSGVDYTGIAGALTIEPGQTEQTINIELLGAPFNSPQRQFRLTISNPAGVKLKKRSHQAFGSILNRSINGNGGNSGNNGNNGNGGNSDNNGNNGNTGNSGNSGNAGNSGNNGNNGNGGNSGNAGNSGNTGNSGNSGNSGNNGNNGNTGNNGNSGNAGNSGNNGNSGNGGNDSNVENGGNNNNDNGGNAGGNSGNDGNVGNSGDNTGNDNSDNDANTGNGGSNGNNDNNDVGNSGNEGNSGNSSNDENVGNSGDNTGNDNNGNGGNGGNSGDNSGSGSDGNGNNSGNGRNNGGNDRFRSVIQS